MRSLRGDHDARALVDLALKCEHGREAALLFGQHLLIDLRLLLLQRNLLLELELLLLVLQNLLLLLLLLLLLRRLDQQNGRGGGRHQADQSVLRDGGCKHCRSGHCRGGYEGGWWQ